MNQTLLDWAYDAFPGYSQANIFSRDFRNQTCAGAPPEAAEMLNQIDRKMRRDHLPKDWILCPENPISLLSGSPDYDRRGRVE